MPNISSDASNPDTYGPTSTFDTSLSGSNGSTAMGSSGSGTYSQMSGQGVAGVVSAVGNVVGDLMTAQAQGSSARAYDEAAQIALANENVVKGSVITEVSQQQRAFNLLMGSQNAQIGAAGFSNGTFVPGSGMSGSGSGAYLARASTTQFNLNTAHITEQGFLTEESYQQQANADQSMAKQARAAQSGSYVGAAFSAVSAVAQVAAMA